jgi:thiamine-phosphate pyrophosphorylase
MDELRQKICGFYAVLDVHDQVLAHDLVQVASVLQVRLKPVDPIPTRELLECARMAREVTRKAGVLLIINDRIDIAAAVGADGVHLGQTDLPLADARALRDRLAPDRPFLIGISTHDTSQVAAAVEGGADYLGFGPVFQTTTKRNPDAVQGPAGLRVAAAQAAPVPVVGIGGITAETAVHVAAAGAAAACCISAVNGASDPVRVARRIASCW